MHIPWRLGRFLLLLLTVSAPAAAAETRSLAEIRHDFLRPAAVPFPDSNPYDAGATRLGQMLFFDPRLSGSKWMSCASCHNPALSWGDGLPRAIGTDMKPLPRRSPTILNMAWSDQVMWDGRKDSLEDMVFAPVTSPAIMNGSVDGTVSRIAAFGTYQIAFKQVFGDEGVSARTISRAIATYERSVVSGKAPFDRWIDGDETAISADAKRGFDVFNGKAGCTGCHSGWNFTDNGFHDIGLASTDIGRGEWVKVESMRYAFKTPTLRDVDRRGPYMHDGSIGSLAEVIDHYDSGGINRPGLSNMITPLHLTGAEKQDLLSFLATLTGENPPVTLPVLPNVQTSAEATAPVAAAPNAQASRN